MELTLFLPGSSEGSKRKIKCFLPGFSLAKIFRKMWTTLASIFSAKKKHESDPSDLVVVWVRVLYPLNDKNIIPGTLHQ